MQHSSAFQYISSSGCSQWWTWPSLSRLCWPKTMVWIKYKLTTLVYRCLHGTAPCCTKWPDSEAWQHLHSASSASLSAVHVSEPLEAELSRLPVRACGMYCHIVSLLLIHFLFSAVTWRLISSGIAPSSVRRRCSARAVMLHHFGHCNRSFLLIQCLHISLRAFVGQPMWKVVATSTHLPPWRLLSRQCSNQLLVTVPFLSLYRGHGTAYHLPSELLHPSPPFCNNWRQICLGSVLANFFTIFLTVIMTL